MMVVMMMMMIGVNLMTSGHPKIQDQIVLKKLVPLYHLKYLLQQREHQKEGQVV